MKQSIKLIILIIFSVKCFASEVRPPIVFSKAEFINKNTTRIPFKVIDHLIVVEAELLNQNGNFIIDTGSETLILNSTHFKNHNGYLTSTKETTGVNGAVEVISEKYISELTINAFSFEKMNADIVDLSHFEKVKKMNLLGIIGYTLLKDFEIFIDMHLRQITLTKIDNYGHRLSKKVYAEKFQDSIDFKLKKHTIVITGQIDTHEVKFGLDTAAEYNQINKKLDKDILKHFYKLQNLKLTGASGKTKMVVAGNLHRFKLTDNIYFGPMKTILTNLRHMQNTFGTKLDGILGYEFFKQKRTIINYKKQKLYFIKNPLRIH